MEARLAEHYRDEVVLQFRKLKAQAERALAQTSDADFFATLDPEGNSLAVLVKHMAGNMQSRWTDFLTADGEKPDRDRDGEFEIRDGETKEVLMQRWETAWACLFGSIESLSADHFGKTVLIRSEPHSVVQAVERSLAHLALHTGQIIFLAKHLQWNTWRTLSVPRGESQEFNAKMAAKFKGR